MAIEHKDLISVIIPVFNVEEYIKKCINSILNQTYVNIQIILINDGSTDSSGQICKEYAEKHQNILVINQNNQGLSAARNTGLTNAKGKYVTFVDSDDYVSPYYIEYLYKLIRQSNADISQCNEVRFTGLEVQKATQITQPTTYKVYASQEAFENWAYQKIIKTTAWGKLYRSELFDNIKFPFGKKYEDFGTIYKLLLGVDRMVVGNQAHYFYRQRPSSIIHEKFNKRNLDRLQIANEIVKFASSCDYRIQRAAEYRYFLSCVQTLIEIKDHRCDEYRQISTYIKQNRWNMIANTNIGFKGEVMLFFSFLPLSLLQIIGGSTKRIYERTHK